VFNIMLSSDDFLEKTVLLVDCQTSDETKLKITNSNIALEKAGDIVNQVSCYKILAIFIVGDCSITTGFLRQAANFNISVFFLKKNLETYTALDNGPDSHYLLRHKQYNIINEPYSLSMAKLLIKNKINNQRRLVKEVHQDDSEEFYKYLEMIDSCDNCQNLLGIEGIASKKFFKTFFDVFDWYQRIPHIGADPYNLSLDIGYNLLFNYVETLLRLFGFDTYNGFYHRLFFKRKSLACDIMEPFRCLVDKTVRKAFNLKQFKEQDFFTKGAQYNLTFVNSQKYSSVIMSGILERKDDIFNYVRNFYKFVMSDANNLELFPQFNY